VLPLFEFDIDQVVFTPGMAKRTSAGPFETAPIIQGKWDTTGTPDVVSFPRGDRLGNPTKVLYANIDVYQGSVSFWITPEWAGNDGLTHSIFDANPLGDGIQIRKLDTDILQLKASGNNINVDISTWTAGTTYCVICRWDYKNTLDGTNYGALSINNVDTLSGTSAPTLESPPATQRLGNINGSWAADAIIEGFTIYRRVLYDGTYGTDVNGGLDELTAIYNAGAGVDPTTITGSNDVVFCLPTDSTAGALVTGTGEAWSHPLDASLVDDTFMDQGNMPGGDWAIWFDGADTLVNCGSDASLDDLPSAATMSVGAFVRCDESGGSYMVAMKGAIATAGWWFQIDTDGRARFTVVLAGGIAAAYGPLDHLINDGKWHYVEGQYIDGTKTARTSVDGYWGSASVGAGAYASDAAIDLYIGRRVDAASRDWDGAIAWLEISDNSRHVAGTDFPESLPAAPFNDGNTTEAWSMETGSGAVAVAMVNTPANDGAIASGAWEAVWNRELTPVEPQSIEFFAFENSGIDFGSGANIDDLPSADCTIECWVRRGPTGASTSVLSKTNAPQTIGWRLVIMNAGNARVVFIHATSNMVLTSTTLIDDDVWHHIAVDWDFGTLTGRLLVDGIEEDTDIAIGAYQADAAQDCICNGINAVGNSETDMTIGWIRISDNRRYTTTNIVPEGRVNPPGNDANAHLLINMDDGTGTTATDTSGNGYNGTITFGGNGRWLNTTDMEVDEPGAQMYHSGKVIGSDQALDGIKIQLEPTNPVDGVILPRISYGQSGRARPIVDYNGTQFKYPKLHGTHTGAGGVPCEDTDGAWSQHIKGWTLYNITQGTSGVPTAIDGDGQGVTGGPNFNNGDEYLWRPPNGDNYCQHPIGVYGIWVHRTAAAVVELQVVNGAGEGSIQVHQMEVQESLAAEGDMENLAGAPVKPPLWTVGNLDVGDTAVEAVIVHSGTQSWEWLPAATDNQNVFDGLGSIGVGQFVMQGCWFYGEANEELNLSSMSVLRGALQYSLTDIDRPSANTLVWHHRTGVWRRTTNTYRSGISSAGNAAVGNRYADDFFVILMNDVSLTVTPASEANSLEGTGLRIDGHDDVTQPDTLNILRQTYGAIGVFVTPRHDINVPFGQAGAPDEAIFTIRSGANNIYVFRQTGVGRLRLQYEIAGGGAVAVDYNPGGNWWPADDKRFLAVRWTPVWIRAWLDGVLTHDIAVAVAFALDFTTIYWGPQPAAVNRYPDMVFSST
jgi:hypothetical protein